MKFSKRILALGISALLLSVSFPTSANALDKIENIKGTDKYETAGIISDKQDYTTAVLINSDSTMVDGISASGLAGVNNAAILLTNKNDIPEATLQRLNRVTKIYIIGGENTISKDVEKMLLMRRMQVIRIDGVDRVDTSYKIAAEIEKIKSSDKTFLVNGFKDEADAVSVASVAYRDGAPILLTKDIASAEEDTDLDPWFGVSPVPVYAIGGKSTLSDYIVSRYRATRIDGSDRYETNKNVIKKFYNETKEFYVASGDDLVYALVASPMAKNAPVVLVSDKSDKSILNNANKVTAIGINDNKVIEQCLEATK
ncbi:MULTISPECIES: cell wall-binding repeat-containing protein [unclassified Clostridioides]|uniref:cell wall-binding repeat-containing protein n=1 Tax=unclassified Clostridioides TaxID=2635829 RepID=UPI001D0C73BF|nr:cell wall-binding repeat-containing protein [Clostridioides sp. ES-S-0049-03]MCC0653228.1 cell wall-binding repeat-containing protein [Clostridioides sp. ES-S-0001-03]MCC0656764.1 cell wall-binding repeat-containing protein [Clostridioides sp. ES-S-0123-01]MCC0672154.1 cell wall-binding repeat-containing protein [Clostridioides sp. ES-S-0145-01]MCC0676143.1 cell wall-binding repeat-containing protein [Clostridioides sp. ES-W-0018-02]MCC0681474.1 cell wall-binding repeat-containing protein [